MAGRAKPSGDLTVGKEDTVVVKESLRDELGDRQVGRVVLQLGWMVMPPRRHAQRRVPKPLVEFYGELSLKGRIRAWGRQKPVMLNQKEARFNTHFSVIQSAKH